MTTKQKKRIILARYNNQKKQALARAQVMITAAAGSAQLMHTISQPIPKVYSPGRSIGIPGPLAGMDLQNDSDAAAREIELAMTWNRSMIGGSIGPTTPPAGSILERHWPLQEISWTPDVFIPGEIEFNVTDLATGKFDHMLDAFQEIIGARIRDLQPGDPGVTKCHQALKKLAIARAMTVNAAAMVKSLEKLSKTAQELTTALSRINQPNFKNHHRSCRNANRK